MANILIVDDDTMITELLSIILTRTGHKVLIANALDEAEGMLALFKFHVVVTDYHLSPVDRGTDLARFGTPLILMSGGISEQEFHDHKGDFDIFIPKPFSPNDIKSAINVLLDI